MRFHRALLLVGILAVPALAGCLSGDDGDGDEAVPPGVTSVYERKDLPFNVSHERISQVLEPGPYKIIAPGTQYFVDVELPPTEGAPALIGDTAVSIGVHFPDIPGCDWTASGLPEECRIPVIADTGPYYAGTAGFAPQLEGDSPVTEYSMGRLLGNLVENLVPHGYAVAAVSVFGTGDSGFCMDFMGSAEQAGVQAAVEFLGETAWSNGNVGLIGRSYDGSTPWEAAMAGSEHLKTIVPLSGLQSPFGLMWRNGSAEGRAPGVMVAQYDAMSLDGDMGDPAQVLCPDTVLGIPEGGLTYVLGGNAADAAYDYWNERTFTDAALENYKGSIYYIHGMQDWNVDNSQAFPYYNRFLDAGFEMKGLFGQWAHMYPDRRIEMETLNSGYGGEAFPQNVRYDWAQDLLEWFDHYLKGTGAQPPLHVEVQDNMGQWRVEEAYPPRDAIWLELGLDQAAKLHDTPDVVIGIGQAGVTARNALAYAFPALSETEDTRIAGNVRLPLTVTPTGPGGQIGATLRDAETGLRLGHAIMDLRFHAGGTEVQAVVPGMPITAMMEFFAMDVVLPAGQGLLLELTPTVEDYLPSITSTPVVIDTGAGSILRLPVVERDGSTYFTPPVWYDEDGEPL